MSEPHGLGAHESQPPDDDASAFAGAFRSHAAQRRLAEVKAARRERESARVAREQRPRLDLSLRPVQPVAAAGQAPSSSRLDGTAQASLLDEQGPHDERGEHFSILVVCTGNVCRSPYFERVLAAQLAGLPVTVSGAGTGALLIERMSRGSQALLQDRGLDGSGYCPRQLTPSMVRDADLVLTASREHRHVVVEELPSAASRVFALLDFADACRTADLSDTRGVDGLRAFVRSTPSGALERHSARSDAQAEIIDPFRQGPEVFALMAEQADPALATVAQAIRRSLG